MVRDEITELPTDVITVVATGPLTSDALAERFMPLNDGDGFYFYDAAAPYYRCQHHRYEQVYLKSRYDKEKQPTSMPHDQARVYGFP